MHHTHALIIPVYNGAAYLKNTFEELSRLIHSAEKQYCIIFVNDGSTDDSSAILHRLQGAYGEQVRVVEYTENRGKGYAIREGVKHVGEHIAYVAFTDVEIPYGVEVIEQGMEYLAMHPEIAFVYGTRTEAKKSRRQYSLYRMLGTVLFRLFVPRSVRKISDTQSGVKIFQRSIADEIFSRIQTERWVFDVELFLIAHARGMTLTELPVEVKSSCVSTRGGVRFIRHGWEIMRDIIRIRWYAYRKIYTT